MWAGVRVSVQQGKWRVPPRSSSQFLGKVPGRDHRGGLVKGAHPATVDLPSWVSAPGCKTSAEEREQGPQAKKREIYEREMRG